jgi:hypothetical protein
MLMHCLKGCVLKYVTEKRCRRGRKGQQDAVPLSKVQSCCLLMGSGPAGLEERLWDCSQDTVRKQGRGNAGFAAGDKRDDSGGREKLTAQDVHLCFGVTKNNGKCVCNVFGMERVQS